VPRKAKTRKAIPSFSDEDREREFWATRDSTEFIDWRRAKRVTLPELKPSTKTISLRLPDSMLEELKLLANSRDVPYQSLMKVFLAERIRRELARKA
jgi:predicted DNA binding CopG/RHH family protein